MLLLLSYSLTASSRLPLDPSALLFLCLRLLAAGWTSYLPDGEVLPLVCLLTLLLSLPRLSITLNEFPPLRLSLFPPCLHSFSFVLQGILHCLFFDLTPHVFPVFPVLGSVKQKSPNSSWRSGYPSSLLDACCHLNLTRNHCPPPTQALRQ